MAEEDDVGGGGFVRFEPCAEIVAGYGYVLLGPIAGVDLRVDYVCIHQQDGEEVVDVGGEAAEAGLVAHEAVDVDQQQSAPVVLLVRFGGHQRLGGGGALVLC